MTLRIAHVTATFPPYLGGTGNVCFQNARELVRRGHEVVVLTPSVQGAPVAEQLDGIQVQRLPSIARSGNGHLLPGLFREIRDFDVVHLHYPFYGGELSAFASNWRRIPLVVTYHQDVHLQGYLRYLEIALRQTIGRATLRMANRLLFTTSDYGKASYVHNMIHDRQHAIGELPNGVDVQRFQPSTSRPQTRSMLGLSPNQSHVLLVARLDRAHYFKGVDVLLNAIANSRNSVSAIIVGDGDLKQEYQRKAQSLGIGGRVMFAGRITDEMLPLYYQAADVTVLPSTTMGEAFGLVLLESMACGTPVIASNLPGVRAVVSPKVDGLLVEPGDAKDLARAIDTLLEDSEMRNAFGSAGLQKVTGFYDWKKVGDRLEAIYLEAIAEDSHRATELLLGED
jgi:glycosyltransferase involved in cell wall biosynthesis